MPKKHLYKTHIEWTGNNGQGTGDYNSYERSHQLSITGKENINLSSDPAFRGDNTKYNPEELFLASLSSCHMLWYLHLCADNGIVVTAYKDEAEGLMEESAGYGHFTEVTLYPIVGIADQSMEAKATALHQEANKHCFIANSCNFPVRHISQFLLNKKG